MSWTCVLDLDGVLVDFVRGAFALHGKSIPMNEVTWDFPQQLGFPSTWAGAFWNPLGQAFWAGLGWTNEGNSLLAALEGLFGNRIVVATSPPLTPGAPEGKLDWIRRHMPKYDRQFHITPCKHFLAGPKRLLIDDHDGNAVAFRREGGTAVVVPRPWNGRKAETDRNGDFSVPRLVAEVSKIIAAE